MHCGTWGNENNGSVIDLRFTAIIFWVSRFLVLHVISLFVVFFTKHNSLFFPQESNEGLMMTSSASMGHDADTPIDSGISRSPLVPPDTSSLNSSVTAIPNGEHGNENGDQYYNMADTGFATASMEVTKSYLRDLCTMCSHGKQMLTSSCTSPYSKVLAGQQLHNICSSSPLGLIATPGVVSTHGIVAQ